MDLDLNLRELFTTAPVSARHTLHLLPPSKRHKQRIIVGDDSGTVTCTEMRQNGAPQQIYNVLVDDGRAISALTLGGPSSNRDKVFVSTGQTIKGISRKGKEFFSFDTNLTEVINFLHVENTRIWSTGEYVYNVFDDAQDTYFYMAPEKINDIYCGYVTRDGDMDAVLACQDRQLRIIQTDKPVLECGLDQPVTTIGEYPKVGKVSKLFGVDHGQMLLYGTHGGQVGLVQADSRTVRRRWQDDNLGKHRAGSVSALACADLTEDGVPEVVVGRDEGIFQVFGFDSQDQASLLYKKNLNESIKSLQRGCVCNAAYTELVACTYGGRIASFTMEQLDAADSADAYGRSKALVHKEGQIAHLQQEVEELSKKLEKEKEKLVKTASGVAGATKASASLGSAAAGLNREIHDRAVIAGLPVANVTVDGSASDSFGIEAGLLAASQPFKIKFTCSLEPVSTAHKVVLEAPIALDVVLLRSTLPIDLLDVESSAAIVSRSPPSDGNQLLATYRCQGQANRLDVSFRTVEGTSGIVEALVIPELNPKTAQVVEIPVKPLSLHYGIGEPDNFAELPPMHALHIRGSFSHAQAHEWLCRCLNDLPARYAEQKIDTMEVNVSGTSWASTAGAGECSRSWFKNSFLNSTLIVTYKAQHCVFQSESASAIVIAKETISDAATSQRVEISTKFVYNSEATRAAFDLLHPKLKHTLSLAKKVELIQALKELKQSEGQMPYLAEEYKEILQHSDRYFRQMKDRPRQMEMVVGVLTDLYVDSNRLQGRDVTSQIPSLHGIVMDSYDYNTVLQFIEN